jgi:DNA-binding HxlR family transcriptional regulator
MRKYGLDCPVARCLDVIGERWTLLILRDLLLNPSRRFQDFEKGMAGLTPSVLSARLKELEAAGVVASELYVEHPPRLRYFLTEKGRELGPVLRALKVWGEKYPE